MKFLEFSKFRKMLDEKKVDFLDFVVEKFGVAYVIAVTREKCSGCENNLWDPQELPKLAMSTFFLY
jgi:hypothetical protein